VFPDLAIWDPATGANNPFKYWEFWLALICQIVIVVGYFVFFRKEQLVSFSRLCDHKADLYCRVNHKQGCDLRVMGIRGVKADGRTFVWWLECKR
jgi:hypothetical protein